jgi:hypothetical protein
MLPGSLGRAVEAGIGPQALTAADKHSAAEAPAGASPSCSSDTWQELPVSAAPAKCNAQELLDDARHTAASCQVVCGGSMVLSVQSAINLHCHLRVGCAARKHSYTLLRCL